MQMQLGDESFIAFKEGSYILYTQIKFYGHLAFSLNMVLYDVYECATAVFLIIIINTPLKLY